MADGQGLSYAAIAALPGFQCHEDTVRNYVELFLATGQYKERPRGGHRSSPPKLAYRELVFLACVTRLFKFMTLADYVNMLRIELGVETSEPAVCRALHYLKLTRKKKVTVAQEKFTYTNMNKYALFRLWQKGVNIMGAPPCTRQNLVFVDEFAVKTSHSVPTYGRDHSGCVLTSRGQYVPSRKMNWVAAMGANGMLPVTWGFPNGVGLGNGFCAPVFELWFIQALLPALWPGAIVVLDNAKFHRKASLRAAAAIFGVDVVFLPSYSPELNPIEWAFGNIKYEICRQWRRVRANPLSEIPRIISGVPPLSCSRWVTGCGYEL
ncbi:transposase [Pycnococcus provasolii]